MPRIRTTVFLAVLMLLAATALVPGDAAAQQDPPADSVERDPGPLPLVPDRRFEYTATEGTWISVDVSPDGRTLVFDLLGDLYTMPIEGGRATQLTSGMAYDAQPRFSPDGRRVVYVSDRSGHNNVWSITVDRSDTTQVTKGSAGDVMSPEWTPDGDYIVVSKTGGAGFGGGLKLWLIPADGRGSGALMASEPAQAHMAGAAFGPDERYVWFARRPQGRHQYNAEFPNYQLAAYDRDSGETTTMTSRYGSGVRPTLSPDGRWLVYATRHAGETGLRIREIETGEERWLAFPVQRDDIESVAPMDAMPGMSFTPDSRHLIATHGGKLWRIAADGSGETEIPFTADVALDLGPEVRFEYEVESSPELIARQIRDAIPSPDGRRLAFTAMNDLYVMDYPNGTPRRLAAMEDVGQHEPTWSPDGEWIAFVTWNDASGGHAWKVRAGGGQPVRLTRAAALYAEALWSPRGDRIVLYRAAARDVQENRGYFQGGLASAYVWVPADPPAGGADATLIGLTDGRSGIHFTRNPDRLWATDGSDGLVSFRWDDTDRRQHVKVTGQRQPGATNAPSASRILMAPDESRALAQIGMQLYVVSVPRVGGDAPEVNVGDPSSAAFPARQLTDIGGEFPAWGPAANTVHWSLGNAHLVYDIARAVAVEDSLDAARRAAAGAGADEEVEDEEDDEGEAPAYRPAETRISITYPRDIHDDVAVLRGGRVITMSGDEIIDDADIVIRGNRIEAVGARGSVTVPAGAEVIDVAGKTIVPGYIDTHYHTQWLLPQVHNQQVWEYLANLAYGVTTTQDVQTAVTDILTYHDLVESGDMIGPRIYHTGPGVFSGENTKNLDHARRILRRYADYYNVNTFKMYMSGNRQQRQWLIMAARELELMPTTEGGLDFKLNITHTIDGYPGLEHSLPIYPLYDDVVQLFATTQTTYSPTLVVAYGGPWAENWFFTRESPLDDPKMLHFTPYESLESKAARRSDGWFRDEQHVFQKHAETLRKFIENGARIGVGGHGQVHGLGWHWELWAMQSGGMDEHDALRAATILGAEAIGFGNDLGSIAPGKLADLVILNADPLQNIRATADIHAVLKNGRLYAGDTLDETWPRQRPLPTYHWMHQAPDGVSAGMRSR